jgi:heptosyltransferase I
MPALPPDEPLESVCVLRLSALGDVCHALPIVRTIQDAWPRARITWLIGRLEHKLLGHLPDVEFVVFDKKAGARAYRELRARLAGRRFDALLHMQLALRASLAAACVPAAIRLGFDRARARELQWLVTNARIDSKSREHVQDSFFGFTAALGIPGRSMRWDIPFDAASLEYAERTAPSGVPTLILSPCSSHVLRNWPPERYAAVADHAVARHGMRVLICGGRSDLELHYGRRIAELMQRPATNVVGKDTLIEFLATVARATAVLTPDSGPAHMATTVGTPVLGLYAATNPARSGPYYSRDWCVDRFDAAARRFLGRGAAELPWPTKIERAGVMDLIEVGDVIERLDALMAAGAPRTPTGGIRR